MDTRSFISSVLSFESDLNSAGLMYVVSDSNSNQYKLSFASFNAMYNLLRKSFLLWANSLSFIKAPMAVPLLKSCFYKINSFLFSIKNLYKLIIRMAIFLDFTCKTLFIQSVVRNEQLEMSNLWCKNMN